MLSDDTQQAISEQILNCLANGEQIPLLSTRYSDLDVEDAYRIQEGVIRALVAQGRRIKGYKIGLTSRPMQQMMGITEPDYAAILDNMFLAESSETPRSDWNDPLVEIELAFVMKEALSGPGVNVADVIRATDFVLPAIEIVDFRVARGPGMDVSDTIADLAAVGGVVLGGNPMPLSAIDVRAVQGSLIINNETREQGQANAVLGNPLNAVTWLANKLSEFDVSFLPGDVILSGSFVRALPVQAGDRIVARYDHGFGDIEIAFT